jgi:hypothetical protein
MFRIDFNSNNCNNQNTYVIRSDVLEYIRKCNKKNVICLSEYYNADRKKKDAFAKIVKNELHQKENLNTI